MQWIDPLKQAGEDNAFVILQGPFRVVLARPGFLRLAARGSACEFWLRGAEIDAQPFVASGTVRLTWVAATVLASFEGSVLRPAVSVDSAVVEQTLPALYEHLPLRSFDARARRFWRNVFWLVRLPGGRLLLRALARRARRVS